MRLSFIILAAVLSSISTASGEVGPNQPRLPAERSTDAAFWSESAGVAGERALRSRGDTYNKDELSVADADDEERAPEFLKKLNVPMWAKTKWADHKLRGAEKLAANQKKFKEQMDLYEEVQAHFFNRWAKLGFTKEQARADLKAEGLGDVAEGILRYARFAKN